jgi:hypothetical protein
MAVITSSVRATTARILRRWRSAALLALVSVVPLHGEVSKEYQIKAGFLYNFTKFVEWPSRRFADENAPIIIAVLGNNPFEDELQQVVSGRKVNGRAVQIQNVRSIEEIKHAHVVFVSAGEEKALEGNLDALHAAGVLTVGESERFATAGAEIVFTRVDDKVRFEINVAPAERGGLKISAQLQKLATRVRNKP